MLDAQLGIILVFNRQVTKVNVVAWTEPWYTWANWNGYVTCSKGIAGKLYPFNGMYRGYPWSVPHWYPVLQVI